MQISFSTKSIRDLSRIIEDRGSVTDMSAYGITLDTEIFYSRNELESCEVKKLDIGAKRERFAHFIQDCV